MADFYQNIVPTFTRLENEDLMEMEASLTKAAVRFPIGVIIPALFKDLSSAAMKNIIRELSTMNFISRVYISLDRGTPEEYQEAQKIVQPLKSKARVLWNDSPAVQSVIARINETLPGRPARQGSGNLDGIGLCLRKERGFCCCFSRRRRSYLRSRISAAITFSSSTAALPVLQGVLRALF